ncbi:alpha/beta fold hydrolase [Mycolicibacterium mengxianglii]|uniref:alpha/beta fold hydrolase n=1 Tax=Mycolicibacterium mengxianglii TaxID=2736649 RepID=UPI0018D1439B|nr:alpha/beta hydrolase [Mycolicibacterium mengxianglii]
MPDNTARAAAGRMELVYETFGASDAPPLLLIAGLAAQLLAWDERFCTQLADNGFRVIRFDNRDIGQSTHLHDAGVPDIMGLHRGERCTTPYTLVDMADDTVGLLDALGLQSAHVVGMSMGGMIAQQLAISHPHRTASLTSIMSCPSQSAGQARAKAQRVLLLPAAADPETAAERALQVYQMIGSPGYPLDEHRIADIARRSFIRDNDPGGVARQYAAILASPDRSAGLSTLTVPTLVLHGGDDPVVRVDGGLATANLIPRSRLVVFPGMGHDLPQELWPQLVDEIVAHARSAPHRRRDRQPGHPTSLGGSNPSGTASYPRHLSGEGLGNRRYAWHDRERDQRTH